jgi:5'(3')-deoxyribonucleotidase
MNERDKRVSDQLVRLVQIVFGLVIAQSLVLYRGVIVEPWSSGNWLPALTLMTVYLTTVLSWIDWHVTMEYSPYNFNPKAGHRFPEQCRLFSDLGIVTVYAYLLFSIDLFVGQPDSGEVWRYLLGFPLVFLGYVASGVLRIISHGARASTLRPILWFLGFYIGLVITYATIRGAWRDELGTDFRYVNLASIMSALALMIAYRLRRRSLRQQRDARKDSGLTIGIDIDGVIGNQIESLRPHIRARHGLDLLYDDVLAWDQPIGDSDIVKEIAIASQYQSYTLQMPVHPGAKELLDGLDKDNSVVVITARPLETADWTRQWLENNKLLYDDLVNAKEQSKSVLATDILIDDYVKNLVEYLSSTSGIGVLVDQPWNRSRSELERWIENGRLRVVSSLSDVPQIVAEVRRARDERVQNGDGSGVDVGLAVDAGVVATEGNHAKDLSG